MVRYFVNSQLMLVSWELMNWPHGLVTCLYNQLALVSVYKGVMVTSALGQLVHQFGGISGIQWKNTPGDRPVLINGYNRRKFYHILASKYCRPAIS